MFSEITHEIAVLVRAHSATVLTGTFAILGTIFGAAVNFVFERIKQGGKVTFTPLTTSWTLMPHYLEGTPAVQIPTNTFAFQFRVLNTFPIPKSVSFENVELFYAR